MPSGGNHPGRPSQGPSTTDLAAALDHHRAGRLGRAEALYRKFLQKTPNNPDALHLLGMVALARNYPDQAISLIRKALSVAPNFAEGHSNLGSALRAAGRPAEASASYQQAIELRPDFAAAHGNLGLLLYEQGAFAQAVASCQRAIAFDPRGAQAYANLGNALRQLGQLDAAEASHRQAAQINPGSAGFQVNLASALLDLRRFQEAAICYRQAINLDPALAPARHGLANSLRSAGDMTSAIACYRHALTLTPREASLWNDLGRCFLALGRFEEATESFRQALALDPACTDAYRNLAACRKLSADDPAMTQVAALAARADLPIGDRAAAYFAVAKALDDAARHEDAFIAYDKANLLYRAARAAAGDRFDAVDLARQVNRSIALFTPEFFAKVGNWGNPSSVPVFVVGLPRSGTSLVEQILASHSRVFGAGELRHIGEAATQLSPVEAPWTQAMVRQVAAAQLEKLSGLAGGADRVIDKLPDNIFMLGVIATLYPAARVIFCRRDPRDVGLSCYFQNFSAGSLTFSYDLADCGRRIRETERLAQHWHSVLPLPWLDIQYETLVAGLEGETRRLVAFLGLEWEPGCLDFHRTPRVVQTASSWQVRQPLYRQSVGRWRNYERHLGPLLAELEWE